MLPLSVTRGRCRVVPKNGEQNVKLNAWMMPENIKFTQAFISSVFSRRPFQPGSNGENPRGMLYVDRLKATPILTIRDTLRQLESGELKVEQIPSIRVCRHRMERYSLDNRRLWVFKQYGRPIPVIIADASKEFFQKLDSGKMNGKAVVILEPNQSAATMEQGPTFSRIVLKWSIENIMNQNMYINKVGPVPMRFSDLKAYFETLKWPLLEDTRAQLQQSLEDIGSRPYAPIEVIEVKSKDGNMTQFKKLLFRIGGRGSIVQRSCKKGDGPSRWSPKKTDLTLLTTFVPKSLEDFIRYGDSERYSMAQIIISNDDEETMEDDMPFAVTAKAFIHNESPEYQAICGVNSKKDWYLVFLESLVTGMHIWKALADLASEDTHHEVANEILLSKHMQKFTSKCASLEDGVAPELKAAVKKYCNSLELNSSQTKSATTEFISLTRGMGPRVSLIQGPPGTGKTKTTLAIVSIAASFKNRVLVSAPTNRAISEVAERFLLLVENDPADASLFSDFVTTATNSSEIHSFRTLQLGDVLMAGNKKKLDTDGVLGKNFLSCRVKRLTEAVSPYSGWNPSKTIMLDFLRSGLQNFRLQEELKKENHTVKGVDFLQFTKEKLNGVAKDMIESGHTLCSDLPTRLLGQRWAGRISTEILSPGGKQKIRSCCDLARELLEVVAKDNICVEDLLQCFDGDGVKCASRGHRSLEATRFCSARGELLEQLSRAPDCEVPPAGVEGFCLENAGLVFCTSSSAGSRPIKRSGSFNYAIVDEAAQVIEAETAIIMQFQHLERLLLVGDPKQLPALVISQIAKNCGYGRSLFERLQASGYACHVLNEQYRMHPAISHFPNRQFYQGAVLDGANVKSESYRKAYQDLYGAYAFIDIGGGVEGKEGKSQSWRNTMEAEVVQQLVVKVRAAVKKNQQPDIGVITPYRGQVELLRKKLSSASNQREIVDVNTVDGFQGGEKDVIIFSAVRANVHGNIGFVKDPRRLNVAITRGRYCVWIVGHAGTLGMKNKLWKALIQDAQARDCFWSATYDTKRRKLDIQVKSQEKKFDSFLRHDSVLFQNLIWQGKLCARQDSRRAGQSANGDSHTGPQMDGCRNSACSAETVATVESRKSRKKRKRLHEPWQENCKRACQVEIEELQNLITADE